MRGSAHELCVLSTSLRSACKLGEPRTGNVSESCASRQTWICRALRRCWRGTILRSDGNNGRHKAGDSAIVCSEGSAAPRAGCTAFSRKGRRGGEVTGNGGPPLANARQISSDMANRRDSAVTGETSRPSSVSPQLFLEWIASRIVARSLPLRLTSDLLVLLW